MLGWVDSGILDQKKERAFRFSLGGCFGILAKRSSFVERKIMTLKLVKVVVQRMLCFSCLDFCVFPFDLKNTVSAPLYR